jgi:hypothetical protein
VRKIILAATAVGCLVLCAAPAAAAITRSQADRLALGQLGGALKHSRNAVVFELGKVIGAGHIVGDAAPASGSGDERRSGRPVRLREAVYLFWLDRFYPQRFDHPGRLLLVGARDGRVVLDVETARWPLVDGQDPVFISRRGPGDIPFRLAWHFAAADRKLLTSRTVGTSADGAQPALNSARSPFVGDPLAANDAGLSFTDDCVISLADSRGKSDQKAFNDFWSSNGAPVYDQSNIPMLDAGRAKEHPNTPDGSDVTALIPTLPERCKDVIIYLNGEGSESKGGDGITVSSFPGAEGAVEQTFTPTDWQQILKKNPNRTFKLVVDGCHSGIFIPVSQQFSNAIVTSTATGTGTFACTPAYGPLTFTRVVLRALRQAFSAATPEDPSDHVSLGARVLATATTPGTLTSTERTVIAGVAGGVVGLAVNYLFVAGPGKSDVKLPPFKPAPTTPVTPMTPTVSVSNPGAQTGTIGTAVSLSIHASDSDGGALSYTASGLPNGLSIDPKTGVIAGTPTTAGDSTVTVTVTDANGGSPTSTTFQWTISAATKVSLSCPATAVLGGSMGIQVSGTLSPPFAAVVKIAFTRPDGSSFTLAATTGGLGTFSASTGATMSGAWTIVASFPGSSQYAGSQSPPCTTYVS